MLFLDVAVLDHFGGRCAHVGSRLFCGFSLLTMGDFRAEEPGEDGNPLLPKFVLALLWAQDSRGLSFEVNAMRQGFRPA